MKINVFIGKFYANDEIRLSETKVVKGFDKLSMESYLGTQIIRQKGYSHEK